MFGLKRREQLANSKSFLPKLVVGSSKRLRMEEGKDEPAGVAVQFSSVAQLCLTLCNPRNCSMQISLSITNSWSLLRLMSFMLVMPSNHLILCCPLFFPPSIFPCIRIFSNESILPIRWPTCWSFSFSTSPSNEYSGLISFRMDWLDLLAILAPEQDAKTGNFIFSSPSPFQMVSCF